MSKQSIKIQLPTDMRTGEREVLRYLSDGMNTKRIAERMKKSQKTVEWHRHNLMRRTGLFSYQELTKLALRLGMTTINV